MNQAESPARPARRLRRRGVWLVGALLVLMLIAADHRGWLLVRHSDDLATYHARSFAVTRIIDGDTIEINRRDALNDKPATRVRLWGIDSPEPAGAGIEAEPLAAEALDLVKSRIGANAITLWLESHQTRDSFGAVLAHVELADAAILNEALLEAGLAKADDRWPHARLVRYAQVEWSAKRRGTGLWSQVGRAPSTQAESK